VNPGYLSAFAAASPRMRRLVLALVFAPVLALAQPADPFPVTFLPGGASAEGCSAQWATTSAIHAYSAPTTASRHLRTIDANRRIDGNDYSESLTAVLRPGLVRARQPVTFQGIRSGSLRMEPIRLAMNDELEILGSAGEESLYFSFGSSVYTGIVPGYYGGDGVEVVRRPVVEVWVRLIEHGPDRPASWINTAEAGMVPRDAVCQ